MATKKVQGTPPVGPIDIGGYSPGSVGSFDPYIPKNLKFSDNKKTKPKPTAPVEAAAETPVDWEAAAQEQYGAYYAIIKSVPELAEFLKKAVSQKWSDSKFVYELQQTSWYKTTSASTRTWDTNKQLDPASAQQQVDNRSATIRETALNLGVSLDDATINKLSEDSLRGSWDAQVLNNAIGSEAAKTSGGMSQLRTGFMGQQLKQIASDYGIQLSEQTFNMWVDKVARGQENAKSFQQYALNG